MQFVNFCFFKKMYNKQTSLWKVFLYDIYALVCFHKLTRSQSLARSFCENKQVRKYRPSALSMKKIYIYYIHTEKYSPKSYVLNFRTQISSSQSEERTMVFTREKNDTSNQKPQRCVSFAPKFPPFIAACSAASHTFN